MEIWKDVEDFIGLYEVSNYGAVRRKHKVVIRKPNNHSCGYLQVVLSKGNKVYAEYVHRLVAKAFIVNPLNKDCVNHKDGDKKNNHVDNLEWVTYSENNKHAYDNHLFYQGFQNGSKHFNSKLDERKALEIYDLSINRVLTIKEIGKIYGVSHTVVSEIKNKKAWVHIHN